MGRLTIQNWLKCTGTLQIFINPHWYFILDTGIITSDCIGSCKSNYHTTTTVPVVLLHIIYRNKINIKN